MSRLSEVRNIMIAITGTATMPFITAVDEHIELDALRDELLGERSDTRSIGHVERAKCDIDLLCRKSFRRRSSLARVPGGEDDPKTLLPKLTANLQAEASIGAGYQNREDLLRHGVAHSVRERLGDSIRSQLLQSVELRHIVRRDLEIEQMRVLLDSSGSDPVPALRMQIRSGSVATCLAIRRASRPISRNCPVGEMCRARHQYPRAQPSLRGSDPPINTSRSQSIQIA